MSRPGILFAGGGTGGHVFPAVAVAEAIQELADVDVFFCGTRRGIEARTIPARGWQLQFLEVAPLKGVGIRRALRGALFAARATGQGFGVVRRIRPRAVLCVGGYAGGPVTLAAALLGVPVAVLEPNRVVGLANRLLAPFARRAYVAWDETGANFRSKARRSFGVPLRSGFGPSNYTPKGTSRILVMGGSQGAAPLNERMPHAIARLRHQPFARLRVLHQAGLDRDDAVGAAYAQQQVEDVTVVPFLEDVAREIADADLIIARAGAVTIAELTAVGRAAILVPLPHAADDHQGRNAEALALRGAAVCLRQDIADAERLASEISRLLSDAGARVAMADASRCLGRPAAAHQIAVDLLALAGIPLRSQVKANGAPHARGAVLRGTR